MSGQGATWNVEQLVPINCHGQPESVWWTYGYSPIDLEGEVGGVLVICNDVSQQHLTTKAYKDQTRRLAQQFEEAPGFITMLRGPDHVFELANASYRRLLGVRDIVGKPVREAVPEAARQGFVELLDKVYQTGEPFIGRRIPILLQSDEGPRERYLDFIYQAIREPDGSISGIFVEGQDVTDHVLGEQRLELVNRELQHRVKNTLATVQAIVSQTLRDISEHEAVETLNQRVLALSRAHDTLIRQNWSSAAIATAAQASIDSFGMSERFDIAGPELELGPSATLSLSMILHELCTNAMKYGALSADEGRVYLQWQIEDCDKQPELAIQWKEHGGPAPVAPQGKSGFGTKLIRMGLDGTGKVQFDLTPTGLSVELRAPLHALKRP